jgi:hypothetical protein
MHTSECLSRAPRYPMLIFPIWYAHRLFQILIFATCNIGYASPIPCLSFSPTGILLSGNNTTAGLWNVDSLTPSHTLPVIKAGCSAANGRQWHENLRPVAAYVFCNLSNLRLLIATPRSGYEIHKPVHCSQSPFKMHNISRSICTF